MKLNNSQSSIQRAAVINHLLRHNLANHPNLILDQKDARAVRKLVIVFLLGLMVLPNMPVYGGDTSKSSAVSPSQKTASNLQAVEQPKTNSSDNLPQRGRTAFVSAFQALVYSGPAEEFYPTVRLQQGTAIEVFHETKTGWAAIRPPKGSFSWIPASEVFLLPGGKTAEVSTDNSVSWIGTSLGTANQYRWQVKLSRGEQLTVIGEETIKDSDGQESLWYRISPPNGEFRWIQTGIIASTPPENLASQKVPSSKQVGPVESGNTETAEVQTAAFETTQHQDNTGTYDDGQISEGEIIDGEFIDGGYIDGQVYLDGDVIDGGIYYEDPAMNIDAHSEIEISEEPSASWDDWQLFEFTNEGLRFPLWERSLNKRAQLSDPLAHDPFSLAMAPKTKGPKLRSVMHEPESPVAHRKRTPWRDPRMLAQQRLQGYPQANAERGTGTTLSALRDAFDSSGSSHSGSSIPPANNDGLSPIPEYYRDPHVPRPAPDLDFRSSSTHGQLGINGRDNSSLGFNSDGQGLCLGPSFLGSNQPTESVVNQTESGHWLSQNWNGLQQQFKESRVGVVNAGSAMLLQLQNRLNEIVTQPMIQWNFGTIKEQVQQVIQGGQTSVERGQARLLLERIEAFEQLALRNGYTLASLPEANSNSLGFAAGSSPTYSAYPPVATASYTSRPNDDFSTRNDTGNSNLSNSSTVLGSIEASDPRNARAGTIPFDASGWMVPVFASTPGQPTHAITDDHGHVVAYVTGLPGMNLDRYVNQAVGIHGLRGYLPQLQAAHIEAQTIVRIR